MFLWIIRARSSTPVDFVNLSSWEHVNCILNWANSMANSAASAVLFDNLRECVVTIELDSLVARISTSEVATTALETVFLIDDRGQKFLLIHLINWGNVP